MNKPFDQSQQGSDRRRSATAVENPMNWRDHITVDPMICHGKACITGTRVLVTTILDNLASGMHVEEIVRSYPSITRQSVQAAVGYAADLAKERVLSLSR